MRVRERKEPKTPKSARTPIFTKLEIVQIEDLQRGQRRTLEMEGDRKGGERSPRDPERKSPTQNKNSRRDSSAESPSTYVSARVQKVISHSLILFICFEPLFAIPVQLCLMQHKLCCISYASFDRYFLDRLKIHTVIPLFIQDKFSDHRGIVDPVLFLGRDSLLKTKVYIQFPNLQLKYWLWSITYGSVAKLHCFWN